MELGFKYITVQNAGLNEAQARIKIEGRNINNIRYGNDTTLMAELEEEVKSLLIKVEEESEKPGLKLKPFKKLRTWNSVPSVQFSSITQWCPTLCNPTVCRTPGSLSITSSQSLPKIMCIESVMPSYHLILCRPLLLPPSIFPSIRVFSNKSVRCIWWPKDCSFSFSISLSN